jgi:hypothetical protein
MNQEEPAGVLESVDEPAVGTTRRRSNDPDAEKTVA